MTVDYQSSDQNIRKLLAYTCDSQGTCTCMVLTKCPPTYHWLILTDSGDQQFTNLNNKVTALSLSGFTINTWLTSAFSIHDLKCVTRLVTFNKYFIQTAHRKRQFLPAAGVTHEPQIRHFVYEIEIMCWNCKALYMYKREGGSYWILREN